MLTIEEAARILRIGRSAAYKLAREYLATDGASGVPAVRIGGQQRVPRHRLEEHIGGPITWPIPDAPTADSTADTSERSASPTPSHSPVVARLAATARSSPSAWTADPGSNP
jgi:excisionase family DNA binding protein